MKAESTGLIILAAGGSQRLGRPKQLLPYEGISLLKHSIKAGIDSIAEEIIVVLGAHADLVAKEITENKVQVVVNTEWQEGIASSIRFGLQTLIKAKSGINGVVIMLCDQPYVTACLINELAMGDQNTGKQIIASTYEDVIGVPAWFHKDLFPDLLQLKGDTGARAVIRQHINEVATVDFLQGSVDIDTEGDYNAFMEAIQAQNITDSSHLSIPLT